MSSMTHKKLRQAAALMRSIPPAPYAVRANRISLTHLSQSVVQGVPSSSALSFKGLYLMDDFRLADDVFVPMTQKETELFQAMHNHYLHHIKRLRKLGNKKRRGRRNGNSAKCVKLYLNSGMKKFRVSDLSNTCIPSLGYLL